MRKQITFEGDTADNRAIEWVGKLAYCFNIKYLRIKEVKQPIGYRDKRVCLEVRYE